MSAETHDNEPEVVAFIAVTIGCCLCLVATVAYCTVKRAKHVKDEENDPLLSHIKRPASSDHGTVTRPLDGTVDFLPSAGASVRSQASRSTIRKSPREQANPSIDFVRGNLEDNPIEVTSVENVLNPVKAVAATEGGTNVLTRSISIQTHCKHLIAESDARLGLDEQCRSSDTTNGGAEPSLQVMSSSFLDRFRPPQGLVEAMKAKLKGVEEVPPVLPQHRAHVSTAGIQADPVKLVIVSDAANEPAKAGIYTTKLGTHTVLPPGPFPASPKDTAQPTVAEEAQVPAPAIAKRQSTGKKPTKRRRQASKSEDATVNNRVGPAKVTQGAMQVDGKPGSMITNSQPVAPQPETKAQHARRSSAPPHKEGNTKGDAKSGSTQRKHSRRQKSRSESSQKAAVKPIIEPQGSKAHTAS